jgi:hypothetical protein
MYVMKLSIFSQVIWHVHKASIILVILARNFGSSREKPKSMKDTFVLQIIYYYSNSKMWDVEVLL